MKTNDAGLGIIKKYEGFEPEAYVDPVGIWTIGYGTTAAAGVGINPKKGMKITEAEADRFLRLFVSKVEAQVLSLVNVPLTLNQFSALVSLVYNIGPTQFRNSTLLRKLNAGDYKGASAQFDVWVKGTVKGAKVTLPGLVKRRAAERALFDTQATQVAPNEGGLLAALLELLRGIFK